MNESDHLLPQLERLLRRLETADTPVIQVWGWPGSGKASLLQAFLARQGDRAAGLRLGDFSSEDRLREAMEAAHAAGALWLVVSGPPADRLAEAVQWLRPGQRLVFATEARWSGPSLPCTILSPQEMLLTPREVGILWHLLTGGMLDPGSTQSLWQASDGWYRPLCLAVDATGGVDLEQADPRLFLEIPPVRFFLRHEVLDSFTAEERDRLFDLSGPGGPGWEAIESRGLWVDGEERDRLPRLLDALLDRERRRRPKTGPIPVPAVEKPPPVPETASSRLVYRVGLLGSSIASIREGASGDERDLGCRLRRSFQVLAYLASSPELQAGREELIEAVWPIEGERTIERNFHPTLSYLRRALEAGRKEGEGPTALLFRNGVYRLNPEITWEVDVLDFSRLIEEGRSLLSRGELLPAAEAWRSAWKLYRGPFLQGHYEPWVATRREGYQRLYLETLRELGDLYVRLERSEEAMDAYRSVLLEDPLQEKIHLAVMRLYAAQGRRDLVRRQYDRLCTLLLDELGVEPLPQTTRDYHRLMA
jgi:DNA-binding SARP family transcriptional activator